MPGPHTAAGSRAVGLPSDLRGDPGTGDVAATVAGFVTHAVLGLGNACCAQPPTSPPSGGLCHRCGSGPRTTPELMAAAEVVAESAASTFPDCANPG